MLSCLQTAWRHCSILCSWIRDQCRRLCYPWSRRMGVSRSVDDDIHQPLLDGDGRREDTEMTERRVPQCDSFDFLVSGRVDGVNLGFFINQPSPRLRSPVFAFTAPISSFQVLERCFQQVTGVDCKIGGHVGLDPLRFHMIRSGIPNSYHCSTFIVSTRWPDLSGGNALSVPYLRDIDRLNVIQSSLVSQLADCVVIIVKQLTRSEILFVAQLTRRLKRVIIWHNTDTREQFEVCERQCCNQCSSIETTFLGPARCDQGSI